MYKYTNIIFEENCGFWRNSSTGKASHKLINDIFQAINNTLSVGGTFCDIQTAFYFINHDILLWKFQFNCTVGNAKALTTSYLEARYQLLTINSISSLWGRINTGIPQGLIHNYNPSLFIKFVFQYTVLCIMTSSISERSVRPFNGLMELDTNKWNNEWKHQKCYTAYCAA